MARRITIRRADPLTKADRSKLMSGVRGQGNRSTELVVERLFSTHGIKGWIKHPKDIPGRPDFFFLEFRLAVFVDGCFWHACPKCGRRIPINRREFWSEKIDRNRRRDERVRRQLRSEGYHVLRIWEHSVQSGSWMSRLQRMIKLDGLGSMYEGARR